MMKKNKLNDRKRTFLLITIPIVALFFCFNTLPLIKGVIYSFTNFKGYGSYDWVGLRNYKDLFTDSRVGGSYIFTCIFYPECTGSTGGRIYFQLLLYLYSSGVWKNDRK